MLGIRVILAGETGGAIISRRLLTGQKKLQEKQLWGKCQTDVSEKDRTRKR